MISGFFFARWSNVLKNNKIILGERKGAGFDNINLTVIE